MAALAICLPARSRVWFRVAGAVLLAVITVAAAVDAFMSWTLFGMFSTPQAATINGLVALTIVAWVVICTWLAGRALGRRHGPPRAACIAGVFAGAVALWSAASGMAAAASAMTIAGSRPYCIAANGEKPYSPIDSVFDLRGTNLYTEYTGYKSTSRWFFDAVLVVEDSGRHQFWNWSKQRLRFVPFDPTGLPARVDGACTPVPGFIPGLISQSLN